MPRHKTIGFRPSDELKKYIDLQLQKDPTKSAGVIAKELAEEALSISGQKREAPPPFPQEEVSGILIKCPMRLTTVPICAFQSCQFRSSVVLAKAEVDTSVCKSCPQYPCESWEDLFAEQRMHPENPIIQKLEAQQSVTP